MNCLHGTELGTFHWTHCRDFNPFQKFPSGLASKFYLGQRLFNFSDGTSGWNIEPEVVQLLPLEASKTCSSTAVSDLELIGYLMQQTRVFLQLLSCSFKFVSKAEVFSQTLESFASGAKRKKNRMKLERTKDARIFFGTKTFSRRELDGKQKHAAFQRCL